MLIGGGRQEYSPPRDFFTSCPMRLRLQTSPPLPLVKAWIAFPSLGHETIYGLKVYICTTLQPLQDARVQPAQVKFELDGFELLDDTPVTELLHENDLLVAISRPETINPEKNKKRKIDDVVEPSTLIKNLCETYA